MNASPAAVRPELTIRRDFRASRSRVFAAWTDPAQLRHWCCPTGFSITVCEGDVRPGGSFRSCMRSPQGEDHWVTGVYREVVAPERLVFTHRWLDDSGDPGHETVVTVSLAETEGGGTRLTLHQAFFVSEASRDGHESGWTATLDNLTEHLGS